MKFIYLIFITFYKCTFFICSYNSKIYLRNLGICLVSQFMILVHDEKNSLRDKFSSKKILSVLENNLKSIVLYFHDFFSHSMNIFVCIFIFIMLHKYTSLMILMIQYDCAKCSRRSPWAITAQKKNYFNCLKATQLKTV